LCKPSAISRSPGDCKNFAYTADRIAKRGPFGSEFIAVTDVVLQPANDRHQFVGSTLRDAGIETVPLVFTRSSRTALGA
jgi:hypothetical protein